MTLAFTAFLRCGEFTVQAGRDFDPCINITWDCIEFIPSLESPTHAVITLPSSKTDPFQKGVSILITSAPGACTCAIQALKSLFKYASQLPELPLFIQFDGLLPPVTQCIHCQG